MRNLSGLLSFLNDSKERKGFDIPEIAKWAEVYYRMSLHIDGAAPRFRNLFNSNRDLLDFAGDWVEPYNYYGEQYQKIFSHFLLSRHPRENPLIYQWRLSQYKPFTQEPFQKAIQVITGAIFQDSNYSIACEDREDNAYIEGNNFEGQTLVGYLSSSFQEICNDPNGYFVVIPRQPGYETTTPRVEPEIEFVPSRDILYCDDEELIYRDEDIIWAVNRVGYFRFKERRNGNKKEWQEMDGGRGYYAHMLGFLPAFVAGGQWNSQGFYESHLNAARAIADEFVMSKSSEMLVNKEASHPFIIETAVDCPECNAAGSFSVECDTCPEGRKLEICETCHGAGIISRNPGDRLIASAEDVGKDLIKIVNPDTSINTFHKENNESLFNSMLRALHLHYIEEAQSGVAKGKDMETRYQFIDSISNDLFDRLITGFLTVILALRNVRVNNGEITPAATPFTIVKPTQYGIKTAAELLEELDASSKANTPYFIRSQQLVDYQDKQFGGDVVMKAKTAYILQKDPMAMMPLSEKLQGVVAGVYTGEQAQLSGMLSVIVDNVIRVKGSKWFAAASYEQIDMEVEGLAKTYIQPALPLLSNAEGE